MNQPPKDHVTPAERTSFKDKEWSDVVRSGIGELTPAHKGWILAFVIIFGILQITNYFSDVEREKGELHRQNQLVSYFQLIEKNRQAVEKNRAEEMRRLQEIIKDMMNTITRQSENVIDTVRDFELIEQTKQRAIHE